MVDYLIIGAGLFGSVFANEMTNRGKSCLVIDKRSHIGGNVYTEKIEGINVHVYGAHIFHTSNKLIWDYVNNIVEFNRYTNSPIANYKGRIFNLPFNMNTFYQLWQVKTPDEAREKIKEQIKEYDHLIEPKNLEEQALSLVGKDIFEKLIKGYTEKQWGRSAKDIPAFIIKRIPLRYTYDNNYFNDSYQGIPIGGYTELIKKMLKKCEIQLETDFFENRQGFENIAKRILYTGPIDAFYNYCYGELEYRSLKFEHEIIDSHNFQGNAVVNYTDIEVPYTRTIEHKHFEFGDQIKTVVSKEYSLKWSRGDEPYYPINDLENNKKYLLYKTLANQENQYIFGGRLAEYKYYDMHHIVENALKLVDQEDV